MMNKAGYIFAAILLASLPALAQQNPQPVNGQFYSVGWSLQNPPLPVPSASVTLVGNPGNATYNFWVVANFAIGNSQPAGPFTLSPGPNSLSASNYARLSWTAAPGAMSYDILETPTNVQPSGACGCAVATGQTGTNFNVVSNSLFAYTVTSIDPNNYLIAAQNIGFAAGASSLVFGGAIQPTLLQPGPYLVSALPPPASWAGYIAEVSDGLTASDCTVGGGTNYSLCLSSGMTWVAFPNNGSGGLNPGAAYQLVNYGASGGVSGYPDAYANSSASLFLSTASGGVQSYNGFTSGGGAPATTGIFNWGFASGGVVTGNFNLTLSPSFTAPGYSWYAPNADAAGCLQSPGGGTVGSPSQLFIGSCAGSLSNVVYNNQGNTYAAGTTQKVQSNSSAAGFQDAGTATSPPASSATVGALWWNTDKQFWDYVSSWADNASTPNYLYAALRSSQDDDQENLWGFQYVSTLLGKIESGTNVYVPIAIIGDSDTSGFGATQKSFVYPLVTALQSTASGWGNAGQGFVTSQAVSSSKNALPTGVSGGNSGSWTYCNWGDGSVNNGHSGQCWGPDNTDATASASGAYQSYTAIFTDCYVYWAVQPSGATVLTIVDGSTLVTTSTAGTFGTVVSQHCGTQTEASHTLKAQLNTSATATFLGAILIDTTQGGGVLVLKMAAAANKAADFAGNPIYETVLAQMQADLVSSLGVGVATYIQMWGANEFNQNIAPATMLTSIGTLSTAMHTASPLADIAVMSDPDYGPASIGGANTLTMWQYDKAINSYANKNRYPFISFLRHTYPEATNSSSNRGCYAADNIHLAAACQQEMASLVLQRMTPSGRSNRTKLPGSIVFSAPQSMTMTSGTTVNIGSVAMWTPEGDGNYVFSATFSVSTVGSGGTCNAGNAAIRLGWTDRDSGLVVTGTVGAADIPLMNAINATSTTVGIFSSSAASYKTSPVQIGAKDGAAITLYWDMGPVASNCTTPPVLAIRPVLQYLGN